jgi:hypothetical protein
MRRVIYATPKRQLPSAESSTRVFRLERAAGGRTSYIDGSPMVRRRVEKVKVFVVAKDDPRFEQDQSWKFFERR